MIHYDPKLKKRSRELRKNSTLAEVLLWNELKRSKMLGYSFIRQRPIYKYIVDFHCPRLDPEIEMDGIATGINWDAVRHHGRRGSMTSRKEKR